MSTFDLENPQPKPGDALRDEAANLLAAKYGRPKRERRTSGKKVDVVFKWQEFGKEATGYLEAKDYDRTLNRSEVVQIWADYSGIVQANQPAILLLITRRGLSPDAQAYVDDEISFLRHQTIWELENEIVGLAGYIRSLAELFDHEGLSSYYVAGAAHRVIYDPNGDRTKSPAGDAPIFETIQEWLCTEDTRPLAVLGGYGAGKTSLARRLISHQAKRALADPLARRPILVRLGDMSRYSSLEGLFGGMFTHDFPINGFNTRFFLTLNEKGRLLVVLDGFDEMKHAMAWADFRHMIGEFNRLVGGKAKVVLLGRPSAFTSTDEHYYVLRGLKRHGEGWRRLPDWPEFHEYELREFTPSERAQFVRGYLRTLKRTLGGKADEEEIDRRADEVNRLADKDPDVFGKPVHAKILSDLASDFSVDLKQFADGVSRWQLYDTFFSALAEREMEKDARRPIGESERLHFLREIAFWLWSKKGGTTSFSSEDLPADILEVLPAGDAEDIEAQKREYLSGAFLEKKSGDIYYFGHRSFAEFLVADRMVRSTPSPGEQGVYSHLTKDGVLSFLAESPNKAAIRRWLETFPQAQGTIRLEYIAFLAGLVGGIDTLVHRLPVESVWKPVLGVFRGEVAMTAEVERRILAAMRNLDNVVFCLLLSLLQLRPVSYGTPQAQRRLHEIVAAMLDRVFQTVKVVEGSGKAKLSPTAADARNFAQKVVPEVVEDLFQQQLVVNLNMLWQAKKECLRKAGVFIAVDKDIEPARNVEIKVPLFDVLSLMTSDNRRKAEEYFRRARSLGGLFTAATKPPVRRSHS